MDQLKTENICVNRFANDYGIAKKLLKIRSFGLYHQCQLKCFTNIKSDDSTFCNNLCAKGIHSTKAQ